MASPGGRRQRKPSMYDVAELAGVSHQTVSRVINGYPNIRETTRQRVLDAIAQVRYTPNSIARALATNRTMQIGVLVDSPIHYGPSSIARAIEAAAAAAGYSVSSISVSDAPELGLDPGVSQLLTHGVDALCAIAPRDSSIAALRELSVEVPTLAIMSAPDDRLLTVAVDQRAGAALAVRHLMELGHRRIAHIAGPSDWVEARIRRDTWRDELVSAGLPVRAPVEGDWTADFGYRAGLDPESVGDATAVFVANDQMAFGVMHGLRDRGVLVPQQISVVGFDDVPEARHLYPPLTTVRQNFRALGERGMAALLARMNGVVSPSPQLVAPELIVRDSTAQPLVE
ncbi:MAG: LacI family DNA-binding transcriptional regulator [Propionicimonas sp.]